jgi:predicted neutral ceramidase superfamily lipid hydrolase
MMIADVLLLIISLLYDSTFYGVVSKAILVISTILLRLSIGAERPSNHLIAISAFVFSIAILLTLRFRQKPSAAVKDLPLEP